MHFLPLSSRLGIAITVYFSFAGKRIPRTESGLVGGNCVSCHGRADKELVKSWSMRMQRMRAGTWTGAAKMAYADFSHF